MAHLSAVSLAERDIKRQSFLELNFKYVALELNPPS